MNWHGARTPVLIVVALVALVASACDDGGPSSDGGVEPPSVSISAPSVDELVRRTSFEITGRLAGSVSTIVVSIDGTELGPARRGAESNEWRFPANEVAVTPGPHEISVTATGEAGTASAQRWIFFELDPDITFEMRIVPDSASYEPGTTRIDDPRLHLFGPTTDDIRIDLSVEAPTPLTARINEQLSTRSLVSVDLDATDPTPGTYPVVVRGVSEDGFEREATHVVTITGPPATTEPTATTSQPPISPPATTGGSAPAAVLSDDFEGPDRWTSTVTASANGATSTVEVAAGGNPGGLRRMAHVLPGTADGENNPSQISVLHVYGGGDWDPATAGPLASVSYSEDQIEFEPPFEGAAIGALFAVVQDGTTYTTSINDDNAFRNTEWQTTRATGLTPADFSPAPGPDFSASGAPMSFGYFRANTSRSVAGITTQHGIDNWTVELFAADG